MRMVQWPFSEGCHSTPYEYDSSAFDERNTVNMQCVLYTFLIHFYIVKWSSRDTTRTGSDRDRFQS
jgi:hypothetical protein